MVLIPLIFQAKNNASNAIKEITQSFNGLNTSAQQASQSASKFQVNAQANSKIASLKDEINRSTESLRANQLQESIRSANSKVAIASSNVAEKSRQNELLRTEKSLAQLTRAENQLASARNRANIAGEKFNLSNAKVALGDAEKLAKSSATLPYYLQNASSVGNGAFSSLSSGIGATGLGVTALTGLVTGGLVAAFALAASAASAIGDSISDSIARQKEQISAAEPLVKNFGISYQEADKYVRETQERVAILGRDLPVSSKEINTVVSGISDNLAGILKKAGLGFQDLASYQDTIGSKGAILTSSTLSSDTTDFNRVFDKLDSGTTIAGLKRLQLYEQSPQLRSALEDTFKKYNIKNTVELKGKAKADFMLDLLNSAVTDEQINRLKKSAAAQISSFTDQLFDPIVGLFGFDRDIDKAKAGTQSIFTEFSRSLNVLIGEGGILSNISTLIGGTGDPLKDLYNRLQSVNNFLESINNFLKEFSKVQANVDNARSVMSPLIGSAGNAVKAGVQFATGDKIGATQSGLSAIGGLFDTVTKPIQNAIGGIFAKPKFTGTSEFARSAASGYMPIEAAIGMEMKNKPTTSNLIIANSSETILTPKQVSSLSTQNAPTIVQKTLTLASGAIQINAPSGVDINQIAQTIMDRIDAEFNKSLNNLLA